MKVIVFFLSFQTIALAVYAPDKFQTASQQGHTKQYNVLKNEKTFLLGKAFSFYYANKRDMAIKAFQKYLEIYGDHSIPLRYLGIIHFRAGDLTEALKYTEKAAVVNQEDITTHAILGQLYLNANRIADAIKTYLKILELEPLNENSLEILANLYERKKENKKSLSFYKRLLIAGRKNSTPETIYRSLHKLGAHYYRIHKFQKAITAYEQLLELEPNNLKLHHVLGDLYKINGQIEKAKIKYEKLFEANPKDMKVHHALIEIYYLTEDIKLRASVASFIRKYKNISPQVNAFASEFNKKPEETEYLFRLILNKSPDSLSARIGLVKVYQRLKDHENLRKEAFITIYIAQRMKMFKIAQKYEIFALDLLDEENKNINIYGVFRSKNPPKGLINDKIEELARIYIDLYSAHAQTMEALGRNKNTLAYYYKILYLINGLEKYLKATKGSSSKFIRALGNKKYQLLLQIGWLLHLEPFQKNQEALHFLKNAEKVNPESSRHHFLAGIINHSMGDTKKSYYGSASQRFKKAIQLEKQGDTPANYFFYLGITLEKQNQFEEAEKMLKHAIKLDPNNSAYLNYLGYIYSVRGINYAQASELLLKALEDEPENEAYLDSLGWLLYRQGKYSKALVQLLMAADQAQKNNNIDPVIYFHLAETYIKLEKWHLAYHYFKKTLTKIKNASEAINVNYVRQQIQNLKKKIN